MSDPLELSDRWLKWPNRALGRVANTPTADLPLTSATLLFHAKSIKQPTGDKQLLQHTKLLKQSKTLKKESSLDGPVNRNTASCSSSTLLHFDNYSENREQ